MRQKNKISKNKPLMILGGIVGLLVGCCAICGVSYLLSPSVPARSASPSWSPNGQHLTFECYFENPLSKNREQYGPEGADVCIIRSDGHDLVRLVTDSGADNHPIWSPDGSQIAYIRTDGIYLIDIDGTNRRRIARVSSTYRTDYYPLWSPDGKHILFSDNLDIYLVTVADGTSVNLTSNSQTSDQNPMWVSNGQKIIFISTEFTNPVSSQLMIMNADGSEKKVIKEDGGFYRSILASNDGQIAFLDSPDRQFNYLYTTTFDRWQPKQHIRVSRPISWSPNSRYLAYDDYNEFGILDMETESTVIIPTSKFHALDNDYPASWSPDGQQLAATFYDPGIVEKYVFNIYYGLTEVRPDERHIYIFNVKGGAIRSLVQR